MLGVVCPPHAATMHQLVSWVYDGGALFGHVHMLTFCVVWKAITVWTDCLAGQIAWLDKLPGCCNGTLECVMNSRKPGSSSYNPHCVLVAQVTSLCVPVCVCVCVCVQLLLGAVKGCGVTCKQHRE